MTRSETTDKKADRVSVGRSVDSLKRQEFKDKLAAIKKKTQDSPNPPKTQTPMTRNPQNTENPPKPLTRTVPTQLDKKPIQARMTALFDKKEKQEAEPNQKRVTRKRQMEHDPVEDRSQKTSRTMAGTRIAAEASIGKIFTTNSITFSKTRRQPSDPGPLQDCQPGGGGVQGEVQGSAGGPVLAPIFTSVWQEREGAARFLEEETERGIGQRVCTATGVANHSTAFTGSLGEFSDGNFRTEQLT